MSTSTDITTHWQIHGSFLGRVRTGLCTSHAFTQHSYKGRKVHIQQEYLQTRNAFFAGKIHFANQEKHGNFQVCGWSIYVCTLM